MVRQLPIVKSGMLTFPTAASPRRTSFTLLLGFGAEAVVESAMVGEGGLLLARKVRPTRDADSLHGCSRSRVEGEKRYLVCSQRVTVREMAVQGRREVVIVGKQAAKCFEHDAGGMGIRNRFRVRVSRINPNSAANQYTRFPRMRQPCTRGCWKMRPNTLRSHRFLRYLISESQNPITPSTKKSYRCSSYHVSPWQPRSSTSSPSVTQVFTRIHV